MAGKDDKKRPRPSQGSQRRKYCYFCKEGIEKVDYKDYNNLRRYTSDRGKIKSRRTTGACRLHQRQVAVAVKRARTRALLPYSYRGDGGNRDKCEYVQYTRGERGW